MGLDECLILHDELNQQIWLVCGIETVSRKLIFGIINERNSTNLEIFVINHIEPGTTIVTEGWSGYML